MKRRIALLTALILFVGLAGAAAHSEGSIQKQNELLNKLFAAARGNVSDWEFADYDGDGTYELFAELDVDVATDGYIMKTIWFVSDKETVRLTDADGTYVYLQSVFDAGRYKLQVLDSRHGFWGVYAVRNGRVCEVQYPDLDLYDIEQDEYTGEIWGYEKYYWSDGTAAWHRLYYDPAANALVYTGESYRDNS